MKQTFTQKCGFMLLVMLFAFIQGTWAQGGTADYMKVTMTFNPETAPDVLVNAQRYDNPSVILRRAKDNKLARAYYKLSYSFDGTPGTDYTANITDADGHTIQTQTATGTQLNTANGRIVKVGNKIGKVTVKVTATLTEAYKGKYEDNIEKSYSFNVKAPAEFTINVPYNHANLKSTDNLSVIRGKLEYYNSNITKATLGKPTVTYVSGNNMNIDVTDAFDITATVTDKLKKQETMNNGVLTGYVIEAADNVTESYETGQSITFSAKVKDAYKATYGDDASSTLSANVTVKFITPDKKIQTYLVFEKSEITKYKLQWKSASSGGNASFLTPVYKIVDADGNDFTDAYTCSGGEAVCQNAFYNYSDDPLDFGKDLKSEDNVPFSSLSAYPNYRIEHTDGCTIGWPVNQSDHRATGQAWIPDDYIATVTVNVNQQFENLLSATPLTKKEGDPDIIAAGMFYSRNKANTYTIDNGHFVLHVLKRGPEISMIPDPETTPIAKNYVMTSFNRFDLYGKFEDSKSDFAVGEDWTLHLGGPNRDNDFWYTYFIPDNVAWPFNSVAEGAYSKEDSTKVENDLAANNGTVLVQVMGSLKNKERYIPNLEMSVPVYETEDVTINGKTYTKYKTGADGKPIPVTFENPITKKQEQKMQVVTGTMYISQKEFGNDPGAWKVIFHGEGFVPISYVVIPWNSTGWDVGSASSHMFKIVQSESVKFILDPKEFTIPVGSTAPAPTTKVVDNFGKDLTKYYNFSFKKTTDTDNKYTTLDGTAHTSYGIAKGSVTVQVTPSQETDATKLKEWLESDGWNPSVYGKTVPENDSYVVNVVGDIDKLAKYDVIYDPAYYLDEKDGNGLAEPNREKRESSRMGKLHFIKAGEFYPGTSSVDETPGMNITFGTGNDTDPWEVKSFPSVNKVDGDFDSEEGQPITLQAGNVDFDGQDSPTRSNFVPTSGGFLKLQPTTNGFLTIDAHFGKKADNIKYYLLDADETVSGGGHYTQTAERPSEANGKAVTDDESYNGESSFTYALLEDHTYYLWCSANDNGFYLHGLLFKPGFVVMRQDTESAQTASMFENGYTGDLPNLVTSDKGPNITFTETFDNWTNTNTALENSKPKDIIDIQENHIFVPKGNSMGQRIRMRASVLGKKKTQTINGVSQNVQVERNPYMDISVVALPMYKTTPDDAIYPGKRVTTTNFVTRMWMTWGGWEQDSEKYPYYAKNTKDATKANNNMLVDTYYQAKSDTVGANNRTIDGFKYASSGNNNPVDEDVLGWSSKGDATTFNLPVRGAYLKFEPEESGTLMVYVVQNGMTDLSDDRPTNKTGGKDRPSNLRRRAMYIVDETGKNVDIASGPGEWNDLGKFFAKGNNEETPDKNYVTEGILRCRWLGNGAINFDVKDGDGNEYNSAEGFNFSEWKNSYKDGEKDQAFINDTKAIKDYWDNKTTDPYGKLMKVFKLTDGSFVLPTKAYVRYTFDVKAGKTYYMFMTGSKLGMAGFAFVPTGYIQHNTLWKECTHKTDEEYNPDWDKKVRDALPEPDNSNVTNAVYEQSGDTPGHADVTIKSTGSTANEIDSKSLKEATVNYVNVTLADRTFKKDEWTSICLPFSLSEYQVKQIFGTNSQIITFDSVMTKHDVYTDYDKTQKETVEARTAHFTQHVNQLIEAGRPYFIKPTFVVVDPETDEESAPNSNIVTLDDSGNATKIVFKHVSLEGVAPKSFECDNVDAQKNVSDANANLNSTDLTEEEKAYYEKQKADKSIFTYKFAGIYDRQQIPWFSYVMGTKDKGNGLYRIIPTEGNDPATATKPYLRGFRAYLYPCRDEQGNVLQETGESAAKIANMWITGADVYGETGADVTTGIDEIVTEMNAMLTVGHNGVFNLQGQLVRSNNDLNGLPQGVYIMNGKKYLIK